MNPVSEMPMMGFGTFIGFEEEKLANRDLVTEESVFAALKAGYRHIDCGYGNEDCIGEALKRAYLPVEKGGLGLKREDIWITEKGSCESNLDEELEMLGTTYVDLYLSHHPNEFKNRNSLVGAWKQMNHLVDTRKARHIGVSNQYIPHLERLIQVCAEERLRLPYANEIEVNIFNKEEECVTWCQQHHIKVIAYSPLGYNLCIFLQDNCKIAQIAQSITNTTPAQVALAWNLARGVAVIPKSKTESRIIENFGATKVHLTSHQVREITEIANDSPVTLTAEDNKKRAKKIVW